MEKRKRSRKVVIFETLRDINAEEASAGAGSTTGHKCTHTYNMTLIQNTHANGDDKKDKKLRTIFYYGLQQSANPCLFLFLSFGFLLLLLLPFFPFYRLSAQSFFFFLFFSDVTHL